MIIFLLRNGNLSITILFNVTKYVYEFPQKKKKNERICYHIICLFVCSDAI